MKYLIKQFVKLFSYLLFLLPRPVVRGLGAFIGFLWIDLFRVRRDIVLSNLKIAFPEWSPEKRLSVGRASVYNMGRGFFEFFTIQYWNPAWLQRHAVIEGMEHYQKAQQKKKGVLLMSLHLGHGDMGASALSMAGCRLSIITKVFKNKFFNDLWFAFRGAQGVQYIDAHGSTTPFDILKALKRNEGVIFVIDQFMGKPFGIKTRFFGKETGSAYGLALFALKTGAPILPVYTYEGDDNKLHVGYGPEVELQDLIGHDKEASMLAMTQRFNDTIEAIIRKHPDQWMWVHRRWKDFE